MEFEGEKHISAFEQIYQQGVDRFRRARDRIIGNPAPKYEGKMPFVAGSGTPADREAGHKATLHLTRQRLVKEAKLGGSATRRPTGKG